MGLRHNPFCWVFKKTKLKFRLITLVLLLFFCLIWFLHDDIGARKESVIRIAPDEDKSTKKSTAAFSRPDFDVSIDTFNTNCATGLQENIVRG